MAEQTQRMKAWPRIVRADSNSEIAIEPPEGGSPFDPGGRYQVVRTPMERYELRGDDAVAMTAPASLRGGRLHARLTFPVEQEHMLRVERVDGGAPAVVGRCRVYSLSEDLFRRKAYKGDLHIHSSRSDGREPPAHVAAACRRDGFDFMALTDHHQYAPSLEAIRAFEGVAIDIALFPGEEVHPPDNPIHIINFGGSGSVNELFKQPGYREQILARAKGFGPVAADADPVLCAEAAWCFERIRALGGLGIFCHPWWAIEERYHVPQSYVEWLFDARPWDAYEVIGGYHRNELESNLLQVARYHDERAKGRAVPVVGVSDAHGCDHGELFGWYYTIVFSPSCVLSDLISSIKDLYSVAVEAVPGSQPRAHGPLRLARYAQFLMREVFPDHDALCAEEGRLMLDHVNGGDDAARLLAGKRGRTAALLQHVWEGDPA
jgi:hypothetical protein